MAAIIAATPPRPEGQHDAVSLPVPPDDRAARALDAIYELLARDGRWPHFVDLDRFLHRHGESDAEHVLTSLPPGLVYGIQPGSSFVQDDHEVALTAAGMASIEAAQDDLDLFLRFIRLAVERESQQNPGDPEPRISATEAATTLDPGGSVLSDRLDRLAALLAKENWGWTGASWEPEWCFTFNRRVRRFNGTVSIEDYWTRAQPEEKPQRSMAVSTVEVLPLQIDDVTGDQPADRVRTLADSRPSLVETATDRLHPRLHELIAQLPPTELGDIAVFEACKHLAERIRAMTGLGSDDKRLMERAFSLKDPKIRLNALQSATDRAEQQGVMHIASGLWLAARDPRAHRPAGDCDLDEIMELLTIVSYLHRRLDAALVTADTPAV